MEAALALVRSAAAGESLTAKQGRGRCGAMMFVDFLVRNGRLFSHGEPVINDVWLAALALPGGSRRVFSPARVINDVWLAALALLVAESDAKHKDVMIRLIENILALPASKEG